MKKEDVKKWIKDHESEIETGAKIAAGVAISIVIGKKIHGLKSSVAPTKTITYKGVEAPKTIRELPKLLVDNGFEVYSDGKNFMEFADYGDSIPELTIDGMHEALEAIKDIPGFNDKTRIQAMFNVYGLDE